MSNLLNGKRIVLGITGSIAAYKAADLASKLTQAGALVYCVLTESAVKFVQPITFQSVTGRKAYVDADLWGSEGHVTHIALGRAADLVLVAPASANTIAKLANGLGDNLLSVTVLASHCPLVIAPAMDAGMFSYPSTAENVEKLVARGAYFIGPEPGRLASGLIGKGRFTEPLEIIAHLRAILGKETGKLRGRKVVVSAGPTIEDIDPVRYLSNRSTGKQGYALAQAAVDEGAEVKLVSGPTALTPPVGCEMILVRSAAEMRLAVLAACADADAYVSAAAIADYRPTAPAEHKLKKDTSSLTLELERTEDVLLAVREAREANGFPRLVVGFAAESENLIENAREKLARKGLDLIVANNIQAQDAGFASDQNRVVLIFPDGQLNEMPLTDKYNVGEAVVDFVALCLTH
ncbi:MAG: bifunctional phosphopantothenoylcysteine decarboxylase/phosphopantothenate--cysteine ligase CoaBC [Anaerolineaceae bacterium]|nr:bifunctional phosphopantothenoylcysteine decarboxylase/phosphopantothenate--cysteine ligase CoaBC [Anaerolineaceae bacterium]